MTDGLQTICRQLIGDASSTPLIPGGPCPLIDGLDPGTITVAPTTFSSVSNALAALDLTPYNNAFTMTQGAPCTYEDSGTAPPITVTLTITVNTISVTFNGAGVGVPVIFSAPWPGGGLEVPMQLTNNLFGVPVPPGTPPGAGAASVGAARLAAVRHHLPRSAELQRRRHHQPHVADPPSHLPEFGVYQDQ